VARQWQTIENEVFENVIDEYRQRIHGESEQQVDRMTREFARKILLDFPQLEGRTEKAVYEHLSYFDDLLAGAGDESFYAKKDLGYFGTALRQNGDKEWNRAKRRGYEYRWKQS
jgi:hypothetical protein